MSINVNNYGNCFPFFVIREITCKYMYVYGILLDSDYPFFIFEPYTRKPEQNSPKPTFIFINRL